MRLRLLADAALLATHHASSPPTVFASAAEYGGGSSWRREASALREQLAAMRSEDLQAILPHRMLPWWMRVACLSMMALTAFLATGARLGQLEPPERTTWMASWVSKVR